MQVNQSPKKLHQLIIITLLFLPKFLLANGFEKIIKDPLTLMFVLVIESTTVLFQNKLNR